MNGVVRRELAPQCPVAFLLNLGRGNVHRYLDGADAAFPADDVLMRLDSFEY
ncbi:MAG: hypothetical protein ABIQ16_12655 [Polyangiaceae bacterium]